MNDQFTELGVGVARSQTGKYYACQVFARPATAPPYATVQSPYTGMYPVQPHGHYPTAPGYSSQVSPAQRWPQGGPYRSYSTSPAWQRTREPDDFQWWIPWQQPQ
jgi:hypothetical protein